MGSEIPHDEAFCAVEDMWQNKNMAAADRKLRDYIAKQRAACARLSACEEALRKINNFPCDEGDGPRKWLMDCMVIARAALKEPARG